MSVESYICRPNYMPTHKPVQLLSSCDEVNMRIITAYNDGSVCLWDAIRKNPLSYFMTELHELKLILNDSFMNIVLVGFDKLKR